MSGRPRLVAHGMNGWAVIAPTESDVRDTLIFAAFVGCGCALKKQGRPRPGWTVHTVRRRGRKITWVHDPNDVDHEAALVKVQEQVRELIAAKVQEKVRDLLVAMEFARTHGAGPGRRDLVLGEERP